MTDEVGFIQDKSIHTVWPEKVPNFPRKSTQRKANKAKCRFVGLNTPTEPTTAKINTQDIAGCNRTPIDRERTQLSHGRPTGATTPPPLPSSLIPLLLLLLPLLRLLLFPSRSSSSPSCSSPSPSSPPPLSSSFLWSSSSKRTAPRA